MQYRDEVPHPGEMRVYLFRKLLASPNDLQREVCEEAIGEVLDQVLSGRTSTIFSCSEIPRDLRGDPADMVTRILGELFTSIYSMETNLEVHVSVRYVQLNGESDDLVVNLRGGNRRATRDHFVATAREVLTYMERVMGRMGEAGDCPHLIFTIHVTQANSEQLRKCCGKLQIVHLKILAEDSSPLESDTSLDTLVNLLQALANNPKTHIRYHNIRLTRLLKQLMGSEGRTVVINYTDPPERRGHLVAPAPAPTPSSNTNVSLPAEVWRGMFRQERKRYLCLREKVLEMVEEREELERFLESLEMGDNPEEETKSSKGDCCGIEHSLMQQKMLRIRKEAEMSIEKLQDLQGDIDHLAENNDHLEAKLAQKNSQLKRQSYLLRSIHMELIDQKRKFQNKLAEYSDLFQGMWQKQSVDIQRQEQVQRNQLSEMLENICQAMQRWCHRKAALMPQEDEGLESRKSLVEDPKL
ncbi:kinesin heavy chain [Drosophila subpulchrella]|uniref:kinesin heavy chain n=1 Tax=Drosophila subpulchrella TaxID=1486046 RepID=UPI0018A173E3|nr:kinesin heavy chain [Drosophila subpulchrella]